LNESDKVCQAVQGFGKIVFGNGSFPSGGIEGFQFAFVNCADPCLVEIDESDAEILSNEDIPRMKIHMMDTVEDKTPDLFGRPL
jgi:hypothetical protein